MGVNYALAQDSHSKDLYDSYLKRLKRFYGSGDLTLDGTENYYDGAYSMLYASSLTNRKSPSGADVRDALENRVLNPDGSKVVTSARHQWRPGFPISFSDENSEDRALGYGMGCRTSIA